MRHKRRKTSQVTYTVKVDIGSILLGIAAILTVLLR
jgi:hypothetical protein